MTDWRVKYTKRALFFIVGIILPVFYFLYFTLKATFNSGGSFEDNIYGSLIFYSIAIFAWIVTLSRFIYEKRIPKKISINSDKNEFAITFRKNRIVDFNKKEIAYSFYNYKLYYVLVIYEKIVTKRGHTNYREFIGIIGTDIKLGWTRKNLLEISYSLNQHNFEYYDAYDKDFVARLFG